MDVLAWIWFAQSILLCAVYAYAEWSYRVGVLIGHCATYNPRMFPKATSIINRSLQKHGLPPLESEKVA